MIIYPTPYSIFYLRGIILFMPPCLKKCSGGRALFSRPNPPSVFRKLDPASLSHARAEFLVGSKLQWRRNGCNWTSTVELTPGLVVCPLRVQVPNKHILAQKLYHNLYYPKPKYLIMWVPGSSWVMVRALNHRLRCSVLSLLGGSGNLVSILITPISHIRPIPIISLLSPLALEVRLGAQERNE